MNINLKCLPENYSSQFFIELYENYPRAFIVAEAAAQIVGYIMCRVEHGISEFKRPILKHPLSGITRKGHIVSIAVLPDYRHHGVGRELVTKAMEGLSWYGASEGYLEVRTTNKAAVNLYKKLGFKIVRKISGYYYDGADANVMARKLESGVKPRKRRLKISFPVLKRSKVLASHLPIY